MKKFPILMILGALLIAGSIGLLLGSRLYGDRAALQSVETARRIQQLIPARTSGIPGERSDTAMPVLALDGRDYVCLLEVPRSSVTLPVADDWNTRSLADQPCRFWGSAMDSTLIIGGNSRQFEFCARLDLDDPVVITDMQGREYTYRVCRVDRVDSASFEKLNDPNFHLTLFAREGYSGRYVIVRCGLPE